MRRSVLPLAFLCVTPAVVTAGLFEWPRGQESIVFGITGVYPSQLAAGAHGSPDIVYGNSANSDWVTAVTCYAATYGPALRHYEAQLAWRAFSFAHHFLPALVT